MLKLGKHRGHSFADVASRDRSYCAWILREKDLPQGFKKFRAHLIDTHGGVVPVGKHRGQFFDFVRASDPDYCAWVVSLQADPGAFEPFIEYLSRAGLQDEESPAKKPRGQGRPLQDLFCTRDQDLSGALRSTGRVHDVC